MKGEEEKALKQALEDARKSENIYLKQLQKLNDEVA